MKTRLAKFLDGLFLFALLFALIFLWLKRYIKNNIWALAFTFCLSLISYTILSKINSGINYKKTLSSKEAKQQAKIYNLFISQTSKETLDFFEQMFKSRYETKRYKNYICITILQKDTQKSEKVCVFCDFLSKTTNIKMLESIQKTASKHNSKIYVFAGNFDEAAKHYAKKQKNLFLFDINMTYETMKLLNSFPDTSEVKIKGGLSKLFKNLFTKDKTKGYFLSSIFLYFASIIMPYFIYYQIFASILLIFCIISFFSKPKQEIYFN